MILPDGIIEAMHKEYSTRMESVSKEELQEKAFDYLKETIDRIELIPDDPIIRHPDGFHFPRPPKHLFENYPGLGEIPTKEDEENEKNEKQAYLNNVVRQQQKVFIQDRIEYPSSGGTLTYYKGVLYPQKGFPSPEIMTVLNNIKRLYLGFIWMASIKQIYLILSLVIFYPWSWKIKILDTWIHSAERLGFLIIKSYNTPVILKEKNYMESSKQVYIFVHEFLTAIGIPDGRSRSFAKMIETIFEYDSAYRIRIQDIADETTVAKLHLNPRRELLRLLDIFKQREPKATLQGKFITLVRLLTFALLHPRIKKAFRHALLKIDLKKLQPDEADKYFVMGLDGYDFFGETIEVRHNRWLQIHNGIEPASFVVGG